METNWNKYWFKFIANNTDKPWNWRGLSQNLNITMEIVQQYPDKPWDWYGLSENPNITWEIVRANHDKPWNWEHLSINPNITWEIVKANPDKSWSWNGLSINPNITMEIVQQNPDKPWDWYELSYNTFEKEKESFELRVKHQRFVQNNLFEEFVKAYMNPTRIQKLLNMGYSIDELDDLL